MGQLARQVGSRRLGAESHRHPQDNVEQHSYKLPSRVRSMIRKKQRTRRKRRRRRRTRKIRKRRADKDTMRHTLIWNECGTMMRADIFLALLGGWSPNFIHSPVSATGLPMR